MRSDITVFGLTFRVEEWRLLDEETQLALCQISEEVLLAELVDEPYEYYEVVGTATNGMGSDISTGSGCVGEHSAPSNRSSV